MNDANAFVANRQTGRDRVLTANYMDVSSADRCETDLDNCVAGSGFRYRFLLQPELVRSTKHVRLHKSTWRLAGFAFFQCELHIEFSFIDTQRTYDSMEDRSGAGTMLKRLER